MDPGAKRQPQLTLGRTSKARAGRSHQENRRRVKWELLLFTKKWILRLKGSIYTECIHFFKLIFVGV